MADYHYGRRVEEVAAAVILAAASILVSLLAAISVNNARFGVIALLRALSHWCDPNGRGASLQASLQKLERPLPRLACGLGSRAKLALENLANLDHLPTTGAILYAIPMSIRDGTGAPVRVFAVWP